MNFSSKNEPSACPTLNAYVARAGICSRRHAVERILNGEVEVNGETILSPAYRVATDDVVTLLGKPLQALTKKEYVYILFNKPVNCECTRPTRFSEKTVYDWVDVPGHRLFTVGRLDKNSSGLLLLTDDGEFAQRLAHPRYNIDKTYAVTTRYPLTENDALMMEKGILDQGELLKALYIDPINCEKCYYHIVLKEGKKREIRRLIAACDNKVQRLCRIRFGTLELGDLPTGSYRHLTAKERRALFDLSRSVPR